MKREKNPRRFSMEQGCRQTGKTLHGALDGVKGGWLPTDGLGAVKSRLNQSWRIKKIMMYQVGVKWIQSRGARLNAWFTHERKIVGKTCKGLSPTSDK